MKKQMDPQHKTVLIILTLIVVISNTPPAAFLLQPQYHYQTKYGGFHYQEEPGKGMDYETMKIRYHDYLNQNPNTSDQRLYRTFTFKPWQFWQWWEMIYRNERFRLPYVEP